MKLKAYIEAIGASQEDKAKLLAPAHAAQTKAELGLRITQLQIEIGEIEIEVQENAAGYPLDVDSLQYSMDRHELATRRLEQLQEIQLQLFPS